MNSRIQTHVVAQELGRLHRHVVVERQLALETLNGEKDLGDLGTEVLIDISEKSFSITRNELGR